MTNQQHIQALKQSKRIMLDAINSAESDIEFEVRAHAESRIQAIDAELELLALVEE